MNHDEIVRLYGSWKHRTPQDVADLFRGYRGHWWIAGGWAIEAFTGISRVHGDIDPSIPRSEVTLLREHLFGRLDVWAADNGTLRPLVGEDAAVPPNCSNLWLRPSGDDSWEYDVILMDTTADDWTYKRSERVSRPLADILRRGDDGIDYLRPEVQLLHKAPGLRPSDQQDFEACREMLTEDARTWLRDALQTAHPAHPWLDELP